MNGIITALIGALIGGAIGFYTSLYMKYLEKKEFILRNYINHLKIANEELFIRINVLLNLRQSRKLEIIDISSFQELEDKNTEWYNEEGAFFGTTAYFLCWLFFSIDLIKREIPHFKLRKVKSNIVMNSLFDLQHVFLKDFGIYYAIQMSIGREMENPDGRVISYRQFVEKLQDYNSRIWFKRIVCFILDFKNGNRFRQFQEIYKYSYELAKVLDAITESEGTLDSRLSKESLPLFGTKF
ncbi:hypothetical protein [Acaryochloris marina]|uniref:Uncharacterized protein n=1 Tax=Acaryochloris marina (strain MBIC 11017) TaxID=329726 RepID=A8ZLI2_ACAM1|nr:hypothetical protein [Acaryochloris marina]ABW32009.1 hypothetical protein AM1_B0290 [Acaryochloris marina MBIC11017]BDM82812.1 hypothetical protein AM10699_56730 [Acaryochloris marina MBIC10699]